VKEAIIILHNIMYVKSVTIQSLMEQFLPTGEPSMNTFAVFCMCVNTHNERLLLVYKKYAMSPRIKV
jgi:hypothetical protein